MVSAYQGATMDYMSVPTLVLIAQSVFSKRQRITLRLLYAMSRPSVVCLLSVCLSVCLLSVCDVGAPYSGG